MNERRGVSGSDGSDNGDVEPRWRLIQEVFEQARALNAEERVAWVHERCRDDERTRRRIMPAEHWLVADAERQLPELSG